jgi:hypothetical protein
MFPFGSNQDILSCSGGVILSGTGKKYVKTGKIKFKGLQSEKV